MLRVSLPLTCLLLASAFAAASVQVDVEISQPGNAKVTRQHAYSAMVRGFPPHVPSLFNSCEGNSVDRKPRWNADAVWLEHPQRGIPRCLLPCAPSLTRRLLEERRRRARVRVHARPQLDSGLDRRRPAGLAPLCLLAGFLRNSVSVLFSHWSRCAKANARAFTCPPSSATAHRLKEAR
jgi:hypothetical protein